MFSGSREITLRTSGKIPFSKSVCSIYMLIVMSYELWVMSWALRQAQRAGRAGRPGRPRGSPVHALTLCSRGRILLGCRIL